MCLHLWPATSLKKLAVAEEKKGKTVRFSGKSKVDRRRPRLCYATLHLLQHTWALGNKPSKTLLDQRPVVKTLPSGALRFIQIKSCTTLHCNIVEVLNRVWLFIASSRTVYVRKEEVKIACFRFFDSTWIFLGVHEWKEKHTCANLEVKICSFGQ